MTEFLPVGVGGDIGVYALLRAFHEQYGTPAVALSSVATRAMTDSTFVTNVVVPGIDDAAVLAPGRWRSCPPAGRCRGVSSRPWFR